MLMPIVDVVSNPLRNPPEEPNAILEGEVVEAP
jgi:hypothetical protein